MIANLLVLLLFIGLIVLFGWLTYRALRARRLWVKIAGGIAGGLVTVLLVIITFFGAKGIASTYFPGAEAAPQITVESTPAQIARGDYLVNMSCVNCHGAVDASGTPTGAQPLSGGFNISQAEGFGFIGDMVTENLTPGGRLAGYSDGELFRVLRRSIDQNGHALGFMSFMPYRELSDEDTMAIIAYLRSLAPVPTTGFTGDKLNFIGAIMLGAGMFGAAPPPAPANITAPPEGPTPEYGKYVATYGECRGCHGPTMTGSPATSVAAAVPNPRPLVGTISQEQFVEMMRSGVRPGNNPFPETMPWQNASKMTDADLAALYAYLAAPVQ